MINMQIDKYGAIGFLIGLVVLILAVVFDVFTFWQALALFLFTGANSVRTT